MTNSEFYNCTTIYMGKYLDGNTSEEYELEVGILKSFANAFALWFEKDYYDQEKGYYSVRITYVNDNFHAPETLATIKFFMMLHGYSYMYSKHGQRSVYEDNE
ncbi:MAG: hypothetical protein SPF56_07270 [Bacteroidaceae bacterium]|nr:hypothetical protein [Bacteroidaceae bacterium]